MTTPLQRRQAGVSLSPALLEKQRSAKREKRPKKRKQRAFKGAYTCRSTSPLTRQLFDLFVESGLTYPALAKRAGVPSNTIQDWFRTPNGWPNLRHMSWVAEALGCELVIQERGE